MQPRRSMEHGAAAHCGGRPSSACACRPPSGRRIGATKAAKSSTEDTQNRFLSLVVAQMKNQDPLNPLDNAQVNLTPDVESFRTACAPVIE
ncbi:MAG TPA: flagellar hook capping FlgD N-terminal domain-containing protein, partial [Thiobacillus sp.]